VYGIKIGYLLTQLVVFSHDDFVDDLTLGDFSGTLGVADAVLKIQNYSNVMQLHYKLQILTVLDTVIANIF
jgi:hypothetical protein